MVVNIAINIQARNLLALLDLEMLSTDFKNYLAFSLLGTVAIILIAIIIHITQAS